jgi:hypothetical protein
MKKSTRIAGVPAQIRAKHLLNDSQKYYHLSQLAQSLSVRVRKLLLTYIHKSYTWMAYYPGVCSECAPWGLMDKGKFCHSRGIGSTARLSSMDTGILALQQITPSYSEYCCTW